jgi:hypothetical protein
VDAQVVHDDDVAGISQGLSRCLTKRRKVRPSTAVLLVIIFGFLPSRIAPISEIVFHERNGLVQVTR